MRMVSESLLLLVASDDRCAISFHGAVSDFKRRLIEATLVRAHGNRTHAARVLGLSVRTMRNKIRQYATDGVDIPEHS